MIEAVKNDVCSLIQSTQKEKQGIVYSNFHSLTKSCILLLVPEKQTEHITVTFSPATLRERKL